jgi:hypothetical protein
MLYFSKFSFFLLVFFHFQLSIPCKCVGKTHVLLSFQVRRAVLVTNVSQECTAPIFRVGYGINYDFEPFRCGTVVQNFSGMWRARCAAPRLTYNQ